MLRPQNTNRLASVLARFTLLAAIALPVAAAAIWIFWDKLAVHTTGNFKHIYDVTALGSGARFAGFALFLAVAIIQVYGLLGVRRTFLEAAQGRAYSSRAINGFKRFAWISLIMVFVAVLQRTVLILIISLSDPSQQGAFSIQFGTSEIKALFMGLLLVFVAHVFSQGKDAKDENDAFF